MRALLNAPYAEFIINASPLDVAFIEYIVPGALVYGYVPGVYGKTAATERARFDALESKASYAGSRMPGQTRVLCATSAAYLVLQRVTSMGWDYSLKRCDPHEAIDRSDITPFVETGRAALAACVQTGWLREDAATTAFDFQAEVCGRVERGLQALLVRWPCGAGKTRGAIMAALVYAMKAGGAVIAVVPSNTRPGWGRDLGLCTDRDTFICLPKSTGGGGLALIEYLKGCKARDEPPIVVVGYAYLGQWLNVLRFIQPVSIIFDEVDAYAPAPKTIRKVSFGEDEQMTIEQIVTKKTKRLSRGAALNELTNLPSVRVRAGLTATPVWGGTPDKLWNVLNMLAPGAFGFGEYGFKLRYCGGRRDDNGFMQYKEATNTPDLKGRASFYLHNVPKEESHANLPPLSVRLKLIPASDLTKNTTITRYSDDMTWNQAIRTSALSKKQKGEIVEGASDDGALGTTSSHELTLMYCCALKRGYMTQATVEACVSGERVVLTVGRKREGYAWKEAIEKELKRRTQTGLPVPKVRYCSGDISIAERMRRVVKWRDEPSGVLIITQHAMGTGVDGMQRAGHVFIGMLPPNVRDLIQLLGRFERHGMLESCQVEIPCAEGTAEIPLLNALAAGADFASYLLDDTSLTELGEVLNRSEKRASAATRLLASIGMGG